MKNFNWFSRKDLTNGPKIGRWDVLAICIVFSILIALGWGAKQMTAPFSLLYPEKISLEANHLPLYALQSTVRMLIAWVISLLFTFTMGAAAAKSKRAEAIIIPLIDLLQSLPVLGFLAITVWGFIGLFPGSMLGPECAAIFAVFTSQAWNMMLSFYQSLRTLPANLEEAMRALHLNAWQKFWRFEVPFAMPSLIWNTMLSLSAGWFFVVASEAISIANHTIRLPGIGSYIALAVEKANTQAIGLAILTMFIVIIIYDQLMIKPLMFWAHQFNLQAQDEAPPRPWIVVVFSRTWLLNQLLSMINWISDWWLTIGRDTPTTPTTISTEQKNTKWPTLFVTCLLTMGLFGLFWFYDTSQLFTAITGFDVAHTIWLGMVTTMRIFICTLIATLIWLPIGVWIGMRPKLANLLQPLIQFLAAFPANLLFPVVVVLIIKYQLNVNIWTSPLIILGTQWYILFNVIAGIQALPKSLQQATLSLHLPRWVWWKKFILPGIFPQLITGIITAAGGAWNASILAEYVAWGQQNLIATGLGSYIAKSYRHGDFAHLTLGIVVMCIFVLTINRFCWLPLCHWAQTRCH